MKILFITGSINQGGAEFQLLCLADLLKRNGYSVLIVALTGHKFYEGFLKEKGLQYQILDNQRSKLKRVQDVVNTIRSYKPELVISYARTASKVALFAKIVSTVKFKLLISERTALVLKYRDKIYFRFASFADAITTNSISKQNYIESKFPFLRSKLFFVPNIVDVNRFRGVKKVRRIEPIKFSYIGRISHEKNIINLIKAFSILKCEGLDFTLDVCGEARDQNYLERVHHVIHSEGLEERIELLGPISKIENVYRKSDFICLISYYEGFSNVISEALSAGLPVIASNIPENAYLVEDQVNGFLVDPHDIFSIACGLKNALQLSQSNYEAICKRNHEKALKIFNEEKLMHLYTEIFENTFQVG